MQYKLLNIHKLLANIATNLVGAFIPIIVLEATGSLILAITFFVLMYLVRMLFVFLFRRMFETKPQIMLLIRIVPILLYSVFVILISVNVWVGVIGTVVFSGLNNAFKRMPTEIILNYSSLQQNDEGSLGFTRLIEQMGVVVSFLVGGYLLGINKIMVVVISLTIYAISVVPLVLYYLKCKQDKTFNKDAVSNAQLTFKEKDNKKYNYGKVLGKKIINIYAITYFVYCVIDSFADLFNIYMFTTTGSYAVAGVFSAVYNGSFGVGSFLYGKIAEKRDIQTDVSVCCVLVGASAISIAFTPILWVRYILFAVLGLSYSPIPIFNFQRLITKSRILGKSNTALRYREQSSNLSIITASLPGLFGTIIPCFILIALCMFASSALIPYHEEKSRRLLVDYLQFNEIQSQSKIKPFK